MSQLITDSGRTSSLVASSRLQAQATQQGAQATRYDVLLPGESRVLRRSARAGRGESCAANSHRAPAAERSGHRACQKPAEVATGRQLRRRQRVPGETSTAPGAGCRRSGLAELGRAIGSDIPANYQLADEPLPPGPPATTDQLIAQALANRPEFAGLRLSRDCRL